MPRVLSQAEVANLGLETQGQPRLLSDDEAMSLGLKKPVVSEQKFVNPNPFIQRAPTQTGLVDPQRAVQQESITKSIQEKPSGYQFLEGLYGGTPLKTSAGAVANIPEPEGVAQYAANFAGMMIQDLPAIVGATKFNPATYSKYVKKLPKVAQLITKEATTGALFGAAKGENPAEHAAFFAAFGLAGAGLAKVGKKAFRAANALRETAKAEGKSEVYAQIVDVFHRDGQEAGIQAATRALQEGTIVPEQHKIALRYFTEMANLKGQKLETIANNKVIESLKKIGMEEKQAKAEALRIITGGKTYQEVESSFINKLQLQKKVSQEAPTLIEGKPKKFESAREPVLQTAEERVALAKGGEPIIAKPPGETGVNVRERIVYGEPKPEPIKPKVKKEKVVKKPEKVKAKVKVKPKKEKPIPKTVKDEFAEKVKKAQRSEAGRKGQGTRTQDTVIGAIQGEGGVDAKSLAQHGISPKEDKGLNILLHRKSQTESFDIIADRLVRSPKNPDGILPPAPRGMNNEDWVIDLARRNPKISDLSKEVEIGTTSKAHIDYQFDELNKIGAIDNITYDEFANIVKKGKDFESLPTNKLKMGDEFTIGGEKFKVTKRTNDTVTIKDGTTKQLDADFDNIAIDKGSLKGGGAESVYIKGDKAQYTGKSEILYGKKFYEVKMLEGHLKDQIKDTVKPPSSILETPKSKLTQAEKLEKEFINKQASKGVNATKKGFATRAESKIAGEKPKAAPLFDSDEAAKQASMFGKESGGKVEPTYNMPKQELKLKERIIEALKKSKPIRGEQEQIYSVERGRKIAASRKVGEVTFGEKGFRAEKSKLKGELTKVEYESIRKNFSQKEIDSLFDLVKHNPELNEFEKITAREGLAKMFGEVGGVVPTKGEISLLETVFGKDLTNALLDKRTWFQKLKDSVLDIANIPRSIMTSYDLSYGFRQGLFVVARHPKIFFENFAKQFQMFGSEKYYKEIIQEIHRRPNFKAMKESGLTFTELGALGKREEAFMSNFAEKIPIIGIGVRASGRAYTGFANRMRADLFDYMVKYGNKFGKAGDKVYMKSAAKFINAATGRGGLGALERAAVPLNTVFFSPRLLASRMQLLNPVFYIKLDPIARREALKSLLAFGGMALTVSGIAKMAGASVEMDPRNADFGKIKVGNTRYDTLGGFQQPIRAASQILSGKIISSTTGKEMTLGEGYKPLTRLDIATRFMEMKEAPLISFATSLMRGTNAIGEKFDVPTEVANRFIPMVAQDMVELYKEKGLEGIPMTFPAIFGVGVQTYGGVQTWGLNGKDYPELDKELLRLKTTMGFPSVSAFGYELDIAEYKRYKNIVGKKIAEDMTKYIQTDRYKKSNDINRKRRIARRIDLIKKNLKYKTYPGRYRKSILKTRLKKKGIDDNKLEAEVNKRFVKYKTK